MSLSNDALNDLFSQETGECWIALITINHDSLSPPIRVSSAGEDVTSRGDVYSHYPFRFKLPDQNQEDPQVRGRIFVDNVDRVIIASLRVLDTAPTVDLEIVRSSDPDTVEMSWPTFDLRTVRFNALVVEGNITLETFTQARFPYDRMDPQRFPGVFA